MQFACAVPAFGVLEEHLRDLRKVVKARLAHLDRQLEGEQPSAEAPKPMADRYSTPDLGEVGIVCRDAGWRAVAWQRDCRGKRGGTLLPDHRSRGKKSPTMVASARGAASPDSSQPWAAGRSRGQQGAS